MGGVGGRATRQADVRVSMVMYNTWGRGKKPVGTAMSDDEFDIHKLDDSNSTRHKFCKY